MISEAQLERSVVRVRATTTHTEEYGTGFWVAPWYVLSSWHVVEGADDIHVFATDATEPSSAVIVDRAMDTAADFALLKVESQDSLPLPVGLLDPLKTDSVASQKFATRGFPGGCTNPKPLKGQVTGVTDRSLTLTSPQFGASSPEHPDGWSGGPIVVGTRVVGITREREGDVPVGGSFDGCPMHVILQNRKCKDIFGGQNAAWNVFCQDMETAVGRLFAAKEYLELTTRLAARMRCSTEDIAPRLSRLGVGGAADNLWKALKAFRHHAEYGRFRSLVRDAINHLLPTFPEFWPGVMDLRSRLSQSQEKFVRAATFAWAEVVIAGAQHRPTALVVHNTEVIAGQAMIQLSFGGDLSTSDAIPVAQLAPDDFVDAVVRRVCRGWLEPDIGTARGILKGCLDAGDPQDPALFVVARRSDYECCKDQLDLMISMFFDETRNVQLLHLFLVEDNQSSREFEATLLHKVLRMFQE